MNNYKITLDSYSDIVYIRGFADHVKCLVFVKGIEGESWESIVDLESFSKFIDEEDVEGYFNSETMANIEADLEVFINKTEGRIYSAPVVEVPFPETLI